MDIAKEFQKVEETLRAIQDDVRKKLEGTFKNYFFLKDDSKHPIGFSIKDKETGMNTARVGFIHPYSPTKAELEVHVSFYTPYYNSKKDKVKGFELEYPFKKENIEKVKKEIVVWCIEVLKREVR